MKYRPLLSIAVCLLLAAVGAGAWLWQSRTRGRTRTPAAYQEAMRSLKEGRVQEAQTALRQCIAADPLFPAAHAELGNLYLLQRSLPRAIQALEAAAYLDPKQPHVFARLAQAYLDARRTDEARAAIKEALRREPHDAYALMIHGELLLRDDNMTGALAAFRDAIRDEPSFVLAYVKASYVLVKLQRLEEAETLVKEGLKHDPHNPALHIRLAETYFLRPQLLGSAALAEKHYQLAIPNNPSAATAHARLGELAQRHNDMVLARRHFEHALRLEPAETSALYAMARLEARVGNRERSEEWTRRLQTARKKEGEMAAMRAKAQAQPQDAALACEAARLGLDRGLVTEAERQIERAVRWNPEHREARELRASLYQRQGRAEEARKEWEVAAALRK